MDGFVCRLCDGDFDSSHCSLSVEISVRNLMTIYICQYCFSQSAGDLIFLCQYCGNIQLQKDAKIDESIATLTHCPFCNGTDMEDAAKGPIPYR
jgi:hypothetical protein